MHVNINPLKREEMFKNKKFWIGLVAAVLSAAAYFLYEYLQGDEPEQQPVEIVEDMPADSLQ